MSSPISNFDYEKINYTAKTLFNAFNSSKIDHREMYLFSEILLRKQKEIKLPNVKWVQNELEISFTKLKAMIDSLEERELIVKMTSEKDQRIKYVDITEKGTEFFHKLVHQTSKAFF